MVKAAKTVKRMGNRRRECALYLLENAITPPYNKPSTQITTINNFSQKLLVYLLDTFGIKVPWQLTFKLQERGLKLNNYKESTLCFSILFLSVLNIFL